MDYKQIISDLKNKTYHPIYLLYGEESYYIDKISSFIEQNVLSDAEKSFNRTILYGKDTDVLTLLDVVKRYPMMSNHQVVIVKEAQDLKNFPPKEDKNSKAKNPLLAYIENPLKSTILVLCFKHKSLDKRTNFVKTLVAKSITFESKTLYENEVPAWAEQYLRERNYKISPAASALLTEYLGSDLSKISNELDKLMLNIPASGTIEPQEIERYIGISKEYNVFELQKALGMKDVLKANRIVNHFMANPKANPFVLTLGLLNTFFTKIYLYHFNKAKSEKELAALLGVHPFFVREYKSAGGNFPLPKVKHAIQLLHEYDLRSKGIHNDSVEEGQLLKEMVFRILH